MTVPWPGLLFEVLMLLLVKVLNQATVTSAPSVPHVNPSADLVGVSGDVNVSTEHDDCLVGT